jgi:hypothetical protein
MSQPSRVQKVFVIGWSVGIAVILILVIGVVRLGSTKAGVNFARQAAETRETSIEEPTDKDVTLWTSKSMRIGLETVVESEREADDTTNEGPQDDSNK